MLVLPPGIRSLMSAWSQLGEQDLTGAGSGEAA